MKRLLWTLLSDEEGQGMVEYGIIVALIAVVVIGAVKTLGTNTQSTFNNAATAIGSTTGGGGGGPVTPPSP